MIRPIDIRLNAAHPELPLLEAVTYTGSPSTVFIRGVPPNCGRWAITAVSVAASFPDGSTTTRAAVQSANGVWVATLPATATSGRTANGLRVMADGIDENGDAVTGYILGVADFAVASLDVTPAPEPGETSYQMLYFDEVPSVLHKGDVAKIDGVLKFYNGSAWEPFAAPPILDNAVTRTSENGVKSSGIWSAIWGALSALPTGFSSLYDWCVSQLAGKLSLSGGTMDKLAKITWSNSFPGSATYSISRDGISSRSELPSSNWTKPWADIAEISKTVPTSRTVNGKALTSDVTLTGADIAVSGTDATKIDAALAGKATKADATLTPIYSQTPTFSDWQFSTTGGLPLREPSVGYSSGTWTFYDSGETGPTCEGDWDAVSLEFSLDDIYFITATRTRTDIIGYQLGSQSDKPLASEAEAEALRQGKQSALSAQQLANIAAVSDALAFDATHSYAAGDPVVYNGTLYTFTAAHTGAWTGSDVSAVDIIARLAGKLDKSGGTMTGSLTIERNGDNIKIDGSTIRFNDEDGCPTGGTISGTNGGGDVSLPTSSGTLALTAGTGHTGNLAALDANGNPTDSLIPAANVALKGNIPYAISESIPLTVTSGAASTTLADRTHNVRTVAAPGTGNTTTITATLPPIVQGKSRDMFLNLTVGSAASDAGDISLSIVEPSGATVQIDVGSVEDIGVGENEIMISERALPTTSGSTTTTHWLVTVRHEDFT